MNLLAKRLNDLLKKNNMMPSTLATKINVNKSTISRILSSSTIPSVDTVFKIATFFGVKMEYFMTEDSCFDATTRQNELCINTYDSSLAQQEVDLLEGFRKLNSEDKDEMLAILRIKLEKDKSVKRASKEMVKSTTLITSEESATIEKMA